MILAPAADLTQAPQQAPSSKQQQQRTPAPTSLTGGTASTIRKPLPPKRIPNLLPDRLTPLNSRLGFSAPQRTLPRNAAPPQSRSPGVDLDPTEPGLPITFNGPHLSLTDRMSRLSAFLDIPPSQAQAGLFDVSKRVETSSEQATTSSPPPAQRAALFNPHSSGVVGERGSANSNGMSRGEQGHHSTAKSLDVMASVPARLRWPDLRSSSCSSSTPPALHASSILVKFDVAAFESAAAAYSTSPASTPDRNPVADRSSNPGTSTLRRPAQLPFLYLDQLAAVTAAYAAAQVRNPGFVDALADAALLQIRLSEDAQATASSARRAATLKERQDRDAQDGIHNVQMYGSRWNQSSRPGSGFGSGRLPAPVQHRAHGQLAGSRSSGSSRPSVGLLRGISRASFGGRVALLRRNGWRKGGTPRQERRYPTLFRGRAGPPGPPRILTGVTLRIAATFALALARLRCPHVPLLSALCGAVRGVLRSGGVGVRGMRQGAWLGWLVWGLASLGWRDGGLWVEVGQLVRVQPKVGGGGGVGGVGNSDMVS
ncbi:MAG: hypothetical protein WDW36_003483 [Sanguina aurantia]